MSEYQGEPNFNPRPRWPGGPSREEVTSERGDGGSKFLTGFLLGFLAGVLIALGVGATLAVVVGARQVRMAQAARAEAEEARVMADEERDRAEMLHVEQKKEDAWEQMKRRDDVAAREAQNRRPELDKVRDRVLDQEQADSALVVKVSKVGDRTVIQVGGVEVEKKDLDAVLDRHAKGKEGKRKTSLRLEADGDVPHAAVVEVTDAARKAGIERVKLGVRER
jgi:biopolymer transport protein ExbD